MKRVSLALLAGVLSGCVAGSRAEVNRKPWFSENATPAVSASVSGNQKLRVRVLRTRGTARIGCTGAYVFQSTQGREAYSTSSAQKVRAGKTQIEFGSRRFQNDVIVRSKEDSDLLTLNGRRFRGALKLRRAGRGILEVIEEVDLEPYLYGVLPREVGADWPTEALKAQAVISRTYALANLTEGAAFDVSNDVSDQVYGGLEAERPTATAAVEATRGQILLDKQGKPLLAFFHAACGGQTDLPEAVWPSRVSNESYSRVVDTFCRDYPRQNWSLEMTYSTIRKRLHRAGIRVRDVKKISLERISPSGRVEVFGVRTSKGLVKIPANRFRLALGPETLRSVRVTRVDNGRSLVRIEGLGWGHGVGLCQWGARGRALSGHTYRQILEAYFPNAVYSTVASTSK